MNFKKRNIDSFKTVYVPSSFIIIVPFVILLTLGSYST